MRARDRVTAIPLLAALVWIATAAASAQAGTIVVANQQDSGPGSLRQALAAAAPDEVIVVPAGLYTLTSEQLTITKSLTLEGAGAAETIISAGGGSRVLKVVGKGIGVTVRGVTLRDGVEEAAPTAQGGGVYDSEAGLALEDAVVTHDRVSSDGASGEPGGLAVGGGVYATGPLRLVNVSFSDDRATAVGGSGDHGGAAVGGGVSAAALTISGASFTGDEVDARGGQGPAGNEQDGGVAAGAGLALITSGASPDSLATVTASEDTAEASGGPGETEGGVAEGAGLFVHAQTAAPVSISGLTAAADVARAAAGSGALAERGLAQGAGVLAESEEPPVSILDATITGNAALAPGREGDAKGGGIWAQGAKRAIALAGVTLDANAVEGPGPASGGGDVYSLEDVTALDTIVSAGGGPVGRESCAGPAVVQSLGHNLDDRDECGFHGPGDMIDTSPILGPLQGNGGPLPTQALLPGSPAIDAGAACGASDARGVARPQGAACDIGAFELAPPVVATGAAGGTGTTSVTLSGTAANPDVLAGSAEFEYGTSTAYGSVAPAGPLAAGLAGTSFAAAVGGLAPATVYHYRLVAANPDGTAFGSDQAFATAPVPVPALRGPALSGLAIRPATLRAEPGRGASLGATHRRRGATIAYSDSQAALSTFTVLSRRRGFRVGRSCALAPPRRRGRVQRCARYLRVGSFGHHDRGGRVQLRFTGRVGHRPLAPGRYRLVLVARDAAGLRSAAAKAEFRVVR